MKELKVILDPNLDGTFQILVRRDCDWASEEEMLKFLQSDTFCNAPVVRRAWQSFPSGKQYLEQHFEVLCRRYPWLGALLRHGREFVPIKHMTANPEVTGQCFSMSFKSVQYLRGSEIPIGYAEGIGVTFGGAEHHAWNCIGDKAFDATWVIPTLTRYFGLVFDPDWMEQTFGIVRGQGDISVFRHWITHQRQIEDYLENHLKG